MLKRGKSYWPIIILCALILILCMFTLQGYCNTPFHEDPGKVVPVPKEKDEIKLQGHLQDMMLRAYLVVYSMNTSDYSQSKLYLDDFDNILFNFKEQLAYSMISDSVYNSLGQSMLIIKNDLRTITYESELFRDEYDNFTNHKSDGDMANATRSAVMTRNYYRDLCKANTSYSTNAAIVVRLLNDTSVYTAPLNYSAKVVNWTMYEISIKELNIDEFLSHTTLKLTTARSEVRVGDNADFSIKLITDSTVPVTGQRVVLYINDRYAGENFLSPNGSCNIAYVPDDRNRSLEAYAKLVPSDPRIVPVESDPLGINITEKNTAISLSFVPSSVSYEDIIQVTGVLTAVDGSKVSGRFVDILLNNRLIGTVKTDNYGSYAFSFPVTLETPGGKCVFQARYMRPAGSDDVYLSSLPVSGNVYVTVKDTQLTLASPNSSLIGGDIADFHGTLITENGIPVRDAMITIYDGDRLLGRNVTDSNGAYQASLTIPYDLGAGNHSLYSAFTSKGKSLNGTTSNNVSVAFGEVMPFVTGNSVPLVLFDGDGLNLHGSLLSKNNMPLAGQELLIKISNVTIATVVTDSKGNYDYRHRISYKDATGRFGVYVVSPEFTYSAGSTLILPYNKLAMVLAAIITPLVILYVFIKITRFDRFILRRMKRWASKARKNRLAQGPAATVPVQEQPVPVQSLDINDEIAVLKGMTGEGRLKDALINVYAAARRIARYYGNDVEDSSTHREFYRHIALQYESASEPLSAIVNKYESVNFGRGEVNSNDVAATINDLSDLYTAMGSQNPEESLP